MTLYHCPHMLKISRSQLENCGRNLDTKVKKNQQKQKEYRVTRRVFSEPVTSKLHILSPNILAGHLKASEVTWISAMHSIFSHPPAHSGPISFSKVENLKLTSGTNKSKQNFYFQQNQLRLTLKNAGDQFFLEILLSKY